MPNTSTALDYLIVKPIIKSKPKRAWRKAYSLSLFYVLA